MQKERKNMKRRKKIPRKKKPYTVSVLNAMEKSEILADVMVSNLDVYILSKTKSIAVLNIKKVCRIFSHYMGT